MKSSLGFEKKQTKKFILIEVASLEIYSNNHCGSLDALWTCNLQKQILRNQFIGSHNIFCS